MSPGESKRRVAGTALTAGLLFCAAGCGGNQDTLSPGGGPERSITSLFWVMFVGACIGFGFIVLLLFLGWWRRDRPTLPGGGGERAALRVVIGLGVAVPIVILSALFFYSDLFVMRSTAAPAKGSTPVTIDVIGHQWWWEVRYEGSRAVTANEIHIPVRTRVAVIATTADVIHSFWVPELNRKIDTIPGQSNRVLLIADKPGVYRGQCAEFCGLQHAHMAVLVIAQPKAQFDRWLAHNAQPAQPGAKRGKQAFLAEACASCHQIRGTAAHGLVGPDLTHFASRTTIASGALPNTRAALHEWLRDPQHAKPGNKMPDLQLPGREWQALEAYMESLR